jgi:antitoxin (DNA-binding transcriptional repressor) of toxin-antitoxin stability system
LRDLNRQKEQIEITRNGKVIAVISPPLLPSSSHNSAWGILKGTVLNVTADFDDPLDENEWEAAR